MDQPATAAPSAAAAPAVGEIPQRERLKGHLAMFTAVAVHVSGFVIYKDLVASLPVLQIVAAQLLVGAACMWLVALATRQPVRMRGPLWRIALLGALAPAGVLTIMAYATVHTSATNATIIFGLVPVMLPILGRIVLGEPLRLAVMLGAIIAFVGIFLIVSRRTDLATGIRLGDLLVFAAVLTVCAVQLTGRRVNQHFQNSIMVTTYQVTVAAILVNALMLAVQPPAPLLPGATAGTYLKILYLGAVSIGVNFSTYNYAMRRLPVARTGLYVALSPVIGTVLAVTFLGESIGWREVLGIVVVTAGVALPGLLPPGMLRRLVR